MAKNSNPSTQPGKPSARPAPSVTKPAATAPAAKSAAVKPVASTAVRNSPVPKAAAGKAQVTHEQISWRAYEISQSPTCGSEFDNWVRAERELKGL